MPFSMYHTCLKADDCRHRCESCGHVAGPDEKPDVIIAIVETDDPNSKFHFKCPYCRGFMRPMSDGPTATQGDGDDPERAD